MYKVFYLICFFLLLPVWQLPIWQLHCVFCFFFFKIQGKQVLCGQDTEPCGLLTNRKHVCGLTCMQVGWLQAGHEQDISSGVRLGRAAEQQDLSLRGEWYHPLTAVRTVSSPCMAEQVSLAGVPARSRFGCIWSFCLHGWGLSQCQMWPLCPNRVTDPAWSAYHVGCFHCCCVGLISCQGRNFLFWLSTPNFACAARHFWTISEPVFTGTHMHACTYATPINRKEHSV